MHTNFGDALARALQVIPPGRVATCGEVARALGDVRAARAVAAWLERHPGTPEARRVVRADGRPVVGGTDALLAEGVRPVGDPVPRTRLAERLPPVGLLTDLRKEQRRLAGRVVERGPARRLKRVGGVDVAYTGDEMFAAAVVLDARTLRIVEVATARLHANFPYIPTYLAYREFPGIQAAVGGLAHRPDALIVDGHGRLHPALFGVACCAGVQLDIPTIGVAKHGLVGRVEKVRRGDGAAPVRLHGRVRGYAWTPPGRSRPIYVSVGHRVNAEGALGIVKSTTVHGYPEPLRIADRMSKEMKRNENGKGV